MSITASSGDELNSEEEALRRNAIQTLDLRKRLTTSTPVRVSSKIHVSPTLLGGLDAQKTVEDDPTEERRINFLDDRYGHYAHSNIFYSNIYYSCGSSLTKKRIVGGDLVDTFFLHWKNSG